MAKNHQEIFLLGMLRQLILLAMFVLFLAVFVSLAKSNFKAQQQLKTLKLNIDNQISICLPSESNNN